MSNLPQDLVQMGTKRNIMREIREYGLLRAREVGAENVLDFSLGNPSVAPPAQVNDTIRAILDSPEGASIHGYTTAQGDWSVRQALADSLSRRFGGSYGPGDLYLTVGRRRLFAAASGPWPVPRRVSSSLPPSSPNIPTSSPATAASRWWSPRTTPPSSPT
jgi:hypothetical protein